MSFLNRWRKPAAAVLAVAFAALLAGCAGEPTRLPLNLTKAEAIQKLGNPTAVYGIEGGGERLQYSRMPGGFEVNNVDLDKSGRVESIEQALDEGLFGGTIEPGNWHEREVLFAYGRPYDITRVASFNGNVWSWRYKTHNSIRLLYIYITPQGVVDHYNVGDDLTVDLRR
jgi:hypothetical protein